MGNVLASRKDILSVRVNNDASCIITYAYQPCVLHKKSLIWTPVYWPKGS